MDFRCTVTVPAPTYASKFPWIRSTKPPGPKSERARVEADPASKKGLFPELPSTR